jgi:hypothetical protein
MYEEDLEMWERIERLICLEQTVVIRLRVCRRECLA